VVGDERISLIRER
jgi:hypothetical protein